MRGTPDLLQIACARIGIIPAHAGNTSTSKTSETLSRDHPRACGEHRPQPVDRIARLGSSPRMRGTPNLSKICSTKIGIIPAHAGNTKRARWKSSTVGDHPRACGEHGGLVYDQIQHRGPSPRMRGTRVLNTRRVLTTGIIPAHAGNTATGEYPSAGIRDHPRACGEHSTVPTT